jgi:hypothetical protein
MHGYIAMTSQWTPDVIRSGVLVKSFLAAAIRTRRTRQW